MVRVQGHSDLTTRSNCPPCSAVHPCRKTMHVMSCHVMAFARRVCGQACASHGPEERPRQYDAWLSVWLAGWLRARAPSTAGRLARSGGRGAVQVVDATLRCCLCHPATTIRSHKGLAVQAGAVERGEEMRRDEKARGGCRSHGLLPKAWTTLLGHAGRERKEAIGERHARRRHTGTCVFGMGSERTPSSDDAR